MFCQEVASGFFALERKPATHFTNMEVYDITIFCWHLAAREPIAEHDGFLSKQADIKYNKKTNGRQWSWSVNNIDYLDRHHPHMRMLMIWIDI